jgi:iron complex outermembrane receptor protein
MTAITVSAAAQRSADCVLTGHIVDPGHAAIVGARIEVHSTSGGATLRSTSDQQGRFTISGLPPGIYEIRAVQDGFQSVQQTTGITAGGSVAITLSLPVSTLPQNVNVEAEPSLITETPTSQTQAQVSQADFRNSPATTIADVLSLVPGVTVLQGNGPRDISISVRGSSNRQNFGVRNVQVFEDGFPVTQPDGLARTDLTESTCLQQH